EPDPGVARYPVVSTPRVRGDHGSGNSSPSRRPCPSRKAGRHGSRICPLCGPRRAQGDRGGVCARARLRPRRTPHRDADLCHDAPEQLTALAQGSIRTKKQAALREAVAGRLTPHYAFLLRQHLSLIEALDTHIGTLDARIETAMAPFAEAAALVQTMPGVATR